MLVLRRFATIAVALLALASCGDDDATTTTTTVATTEATTAVTSTVVTPSSTVPEDSRPLAGFTSMLVEDPLYGTGFHEMTLEVPAEMGPDWINDGSFAWSVNPLVGEVAGANRLGLGFDSSYGGRAVSGIGPDMFLLAAWVENPSADVDPWPSSYVLYGRGEGGWEVLASISDTIVLDFLETTTDFAAWKPPGTVYARTTVKTFDWTGSAHFVADVHVLDFPANTNEFRAEIECTLATALECILLSDDGVLRPGDEGESVEALQQALINIGYLNPPSDGKYGSNTQAAVRRFQRDYRLAVDGRVGPQTQAIIDDVLAGTSLIVVASQHGVGPVLFGTPVATALPALTAKLGAFDYSVGWEMGACGPTPPYGGWQWYKVTWGGFTAWFTERGGSRMFDGWVVTDLGNVPSNLYFEGGIAPSWKWSNFASLGAAYDEFYGWWYHGSFGYGMGTFTSPPSNPPAATAQVLGFATGTGAILYDC